MTPSQELMKKHRMTPSRVAGSVYVYRLSDTKRDGTQLGPCELCHKPVDGSVWLQTEARAFVTPDFELGLTQHECYSHFGHRNCLEAAQR